MRVAVPLSRFAVLMRRGSASYVRCHSRFGSGKTHKKKKHASTLTNGTENKKPTVDLPMSNHHKNLSKNPEACAWKDWVNAAAGIATVGVFIFSVYSWNRQETQFHTDQRAWVSIAKPNVPNIAVGQRIEFSVIDENTGKTPASIKSIEIRFGKSDYPFTNIDWFFNTNVVGVSVIAPNGRIVTDYYEPTPISEDTFRLISNGAQQHFFQVRLVYMDAFGYTRQTKAGFIIRSPNENSIVDPFGDWIMD